MKQHFVPSATNVRDVQVETAESSSDNIANDLSAAILHCTLHSGTGGNASTETCKCDDAGSAFKNS